MPTISRPQNMDLLITIVNRGTGKKVLELLKEEGVTFNHIASGKGTADVDVLDYFGLTDSKKDVILSLLPKVLINRIFSHLISELHFDEPATGIAFTISIDSLVDSHVLHAIMGGK